MKEKKKNTTYIVPLKNYISIKHKMSRAEQYPEGNVDKKQEADQKVCLKTWKISPTMTAGSGHESSFLDKLICRILYKIESISIYSEQVHHNMWELKIMFIISLYNCTLKNNVPELCCILDRQIDHQHQYQQKKLPNFFQSRKKLQLLYILHYSPRIC